MKIGLFFGSFNPIHIGHLIIANHIANFYTDQVWFIVTPQSPFKKESQLLEATKRFELIKLAIETNPCFIASDIEFTLTAPFYTINTLDALSTKHENMQFFLIIGSDNFSNLFRWNSAEKIINNYKILVYERPGFVVPKFHVQNNIQFIDSPLLDISSTKIRNLITHKKSVRYLVPECVRVAIEEKGYYK